MRNGYPKDGEAFAEQMLTELNVYSFVDQAMEALRAGDADKANENWLYAIHQLGYVQDRIDKERQLQILTHNYCDQAMNVLDSVGKILSENGGEGRPWPELVYATEMPQYQKMKGVH